MSERDELAMELFIGDNFNQPREASIADWEYFQDSNNFQGRVEHYEVMAGHILAAGYRKPRTISTHQERATLKPGTICVDRAGNAWKRGFGSWVGTGEGGPLYDEENLTLTVLHEPEPTA